MSEASSEVEPETEHKDRERWKAFKAAFGRWLRERWEEATDVHDLAWPPAWLASGAFVVVVGLITFVIIPIVAAIGASVGGAAAVRAGAGASWLAGLDLMAVVTDAIGAWFDSRTAGLDLDPGLLVTIWWISVAAAFGLAFLFKSRGAQLAWILQGAAAAAMAWSVTEPPSQATAAGIVLFWWAIGSVFALRRGTVRRVVAVATDDPKPPVLHSSDQAVSRSSLRAAADLLDAVGDVFDGADPRAAEIGQEVRELRRSLVPPREYGPLPSEHEAREGWRARMAPFVTTADRGPMVTVHAEVAFTMEVVLTDAAAAAYLGALHDPDPITEPLEALAQCAAWMVRCGQTQKAFTMLGAWWRSTRHRWAEQNPDGAPLEAEAALSALDRAWPSDFTLADRAELREALSRAWVPARTGT